MINYEQALHDAELEHASLSKELEAIRAHIILSAEELQVQPDPTTINIQIQEAEKQLQVLEANLCNRINQYYNDIK